MRNLIHAWTKMASGTYAYHTLRVEFIFVALLSLSLVSPAFSFPDDPWPPILSSSLSSPPACQDPVLNFLNGGYVCDSANFVFNFEITGTPPFTIIYSLDGILQPPLIANMSPFFYLVNIPWSDSIKVLSVTSDTCTGQITGPFDYVKTVDPITYSNFIIDCDQAAQTYTVSFDLQGGVFLFNSIGSTNGAINGNHFISNTIPVAQAYDIAIMSGLMCDTLFLSGISGCPVNCPTGFGSIISDTTVCAGADLTLMASGGNTYAWNGPNAFVSALQNPVLSNLTLPDAGTYTVIITDANLCKDTLSTNVLVHEITGHIIPDTAVCEGNDITLSASGGTDYQWSGPNAFTSTLANPVISQSMPADAGIYLVTISDLFCSEVLMTTLTVHPLPAVMAVADQPAYCEGDTVYLQVNASQSYSWSGPLGQVSNLQSPVLPAITLMQQGLYSVQITDANQCSNVGQVNVVVNASPQLVITNPVTITPGESVTLTVSGASMYQWSPATGLNCDSCAKVIASPVNSTTYCVTGALDGCEAEACVMVTVFLDCDTYHPNVFSPNKDGINDLWCAALPACATKQSLTIFDRWGDALFYQTGDDVCWDGTSVHKEVNPGVYTYFIELQMRDGTRAYRSGDITVLR